MEKNEFLKLFKKNKKKILWGILVSSLLGSLIAENFIKVHAVTNIDGKMFFHAWFGFISCASFVLFAMVIGLFIKRQEGYYKEHKND